MLILETTDSLRTILNAVQSGVVLIDARTHEIVEVNPAAAAMIGAAPPDVVGRVCHAFICPALKGVCSSNGKSRQ